MLKDAIRRVLPVLPWGWATWVGRIDFYLRPHKREIWGGPFNGQTVRVSIVKAILNECAPIAIVETGTFRAATTHFLAQSTSKPVYTVERDPVNFGFASERLRGCPNVSLEADDSRSFLRKCVKLPNLQSGPVLFYLDAHWNDDLPLAEEIEIIFSALSGAIVMVDDFQVPGEPGYIYDDFGPGKALTSEYLLGPCKKFNLIQFFPSIPAREETGARRGCVVLAGSPVIISRLERIPFLIRDAIG